MKKINLTLPLLILFFLPLTFTHTNTHVKNFKQFDTTSHNIGNPALRTLIPADLTFLIADLKYKENDLKIVEFGDGISAGLKVLDHIYGEGKVWTVLWDYLKTFDLPIWYVGEYRSNPRTVSWSHFVRQGGNYAPHLTALKQNSFFQKAAQSDSKFNPFDIKTYKGIIIIKRFQPAPEELENFTKNHPDFLILNMATTKYASDKNLTNRLFTTDQLKKFRPKCVVYPREYDPTLAQKIINDLQCNWFVIKPVNAARGNGILMVNKEHLDTKLKQILFAYHNHLPYDNNYSIKSNAPFVNEYWRYDRNSHFLVEEYAESKTILVRDKPYDATMRVIFTLAYDQGQISLTFLDAYWKRPVKALNEQANFREKHLSKHQPNFYESVGLEVSKEDLEAVKKLMRECMPEVYFNMLTTYQAEQEAKNLPKAS